ncbi:hypothetical protein PPERSA_02823 [Pseudocohnilembus persalinus]|uniref:Uncharacterized protein n=1 Tax=Pseudocohnilembus persalinus TaxID=266149 RepID=A0A0V0QMI8_PSEPJ|nr:hypothetical protein PPERSA_02823 [Pseudocohnilembus persalinus]|eukprot:KRX03444.1 hypothetical protein PPERSA_02823 [Pseudocohnilembus persalinus]
MKQFISLYLQNYEKYLKQNIPILNDDGTKLTNLDLSFENISNCYLKFHEEKQKKHKQLQRKLQQERDLQQAPEKQLKELLKIEEEEDRQIIEKIQNPPQKVEPDHQFSNSKQNRQSHFQQGTNNININNNQLQNQQQQQINIQESRIPTSQNIEDNQQLQPSQQNIEGQNLLPNQQQNQMGQSGGGQKSKKNENLSRVSNVSIINGSNNNIQNENSRQQQELEELEQEVYSSQKGSGNDQMSSINDEFMHQMQGDKNIDLGKFRMQDQDLENFLKVLENNQSFWGELNLEDQDLTDITCVKLSEILKKNQPNIINLNLNQNTKISHFTGIHIGDALKQNTTLRQISFNRVNLGTKGANRVIESIQDNKHIRNYDFGNLTDSSLKYLISYMYKTHSIKNLSFGEDDQEKWQESTKQQFLQCLRENYANTQLLSVNINCEVINYTKESDKYEKQHRHNNFIAEISILIKKNRNQYILKKTNAYKAKELNTQHPEYYSGDNHPENAYKFSLKTYISNVIDTLLDEGLYYLEKERANATRDENIWEITKQPLNKSLLEDLFTADGSLLVLARYMIQKIEEKPELGGEY